MGCDEPKYQCWRCGEWHSKGHGCKVNIKMWTGIVEDGDWVRGGDGFGGGFLCPKCGSKRYDYNTIWFRYECDKCGFYTEQLPPEEKERHGN